MVVVRIPFTYKLELDVEKPSIGSLANTMSCFLGNILGMSEGIRY